VLAAFLLMFAAPEVDLEDIEPGLQSGQFIARGGTLRGVEIGGAVLTLLSG